jgi:hypothetical protein
MGQPGAPSKRSPGNVSGLPGSSSHPLVHDLGELNVSTIMHFTAAEGASEHCQPLARTLTAQRIFDWLTNTSGHRAPAERRHHSQGRPPGSPVLTGARPWPSMWLHDRRFEVSVTVQRRHRSTHLGDGLRA